MKHLLQYILLAIVIITLVATVTKPSEEKCKAEASQQVAQYMKSEVSTGYALVNRFIENTSQKAISVEDNLVYQSITYSFKGKSRNIGWGAFGFVCVDLGKD